jgi:molecular chaperone DnaK
LGELVLGIDLGTTNSVVAVADATSARVIADADGQRLLPSVVSFAPDGDVVVGEIARERRLLDAKNTVYAVKRLIGRPYASPEVKRAKERSPFEIVEAENGGVEVVARGEHWSLPEISAYVLREARARAERALGQSCTKAVITVPANFNELQRSATKAAGAIAGLDVLRILNEPTAAAIAYGYGPENAKRVAVYDLGGGTFDVTILELEEDVFEVVATAGDTFLGGDDFDLVLAERLCEQFLDTNGIELRGDKQAFERVRAASEWTKCMLSTNEEVEVRVPAIAFGRGGSSVDLLTTVTRGDFDALIRPLIDKSMRVCDLAFKIAVCTPADVDHVVLVGGSSRIPLIRNRVAEIFGKEPQTYFDPDLVVALGAAIQAYSLAGDPNLRAITIVPSPEEVEAAKAKKAAARAGRPDQPAFAPATLGSMELRKVAVPRMPDIREEVNDLPARSMRDTRTERENIGTSKTLPPPSSRYSTPASVDAFAPTNRPPTPTSSVPRTTAVSAPPSRPATPSTPPRRPITGVGFYRAENVEPRRKKKPTQPGAVIGRTATPDSGVPRERKNTPVVAMDAKSMLGLPPVLRGDTPAPGSLPPGAMPLPRLTPPPKTTPPPRDLPRQSVPAPPPSLDLDEPLKEKVRVSLAHRKPMLLMDVTPHSLGIETVGGYCERVIKQNAPVPVEQTRMFTTARDGQDSVSVTVCQGESRTFAENQSLGVLHLTGLRPARRGEVRIEVTFMLDADGTLHVRAVDASTGRAQAIRVNLVGGFSAAEIDALRRKQERTLFAS